MKIVINVALIQTSPGCEVKYEEAWEMNKTGETQLFGVSNGGK